MYFDQQATHRLQRHCRKRVREGDYQADLLNARGPSVVVQGEIATVV